MVKKFNSVLAFGDSHVAGCELAEGADLDHYLSGKISIHDADLPGKALAFPKIVADQLNVPCYNFAMTGGSNERSLRLLVSEIEKHPNSLVLFGYTCTDRKEFYYPDSGLFLGKDQDNFIQTGVQWKGVIESLVDKSKMTHPINNLVVDNLLRPYNNLRQTMFLVDCVCTLYALDFLHIPLFPEDIEDFPNLLNFEGHKDYITWCKEKQFKQLPFLHYDIEAHKELAKLIIKTI